MGGVVDVSTNGTGLQKKGKTSADRCEKGGEALELEHGDSIVLPMKVSPGRTSVTLMIKLDGGDDLGEAGVVGSAASKKGDEEVPQLDTAKEKAGKSKKGADRTQAPGVDDDRAKTPGDPRKDAPGVGDNSA